MPEAKDGFQAMVSSPQQSLELLQKDKHAQIIDVREKWEWDEEHVNNSILIPSSAMKLEDFSPFKKDQPLLILCHTGNRSFFVTQKLRQLGYVHAQNMSGGIEVLSPEMREKMGALLKGRTP